ncbi:hypothetical protein BGW80DRAFT_1266079 [Lactifluus volemus]|nr:hypothetical protein BGW80DRAFT_1266079 [Lactifluus volemus]
MTVCRRHNHQNRTEIPAPLCHATARSKIPLWIKFKGYSAESRWISPHSKSIRFTKLCYMISVQPNNLQKENVITKLMGLPNAACPSFHCCCHPRTSLLTMPRALAPPTPPLQTPRPKATPLCIALSFRSAAPENLC